MRVENLSIGALAKRAGTNTPTIRYYESIDLLPRAKRQGGGQRRYVEADVQLLRFVLRCRDFGFAVEQVRRLVQLVENPAKPCAEVRDMALRQLTEVRAKLAELHELERMIGDFVTRCDHCGDGVGGRCLPLTELARSTAVERRAARGARQRIPARRPRAAGRK